MKTGTRIATGVVAAVLAVLLLRGCVATSYLIPSEGMETSLYQGERILVNKWSYGLRVPFPSWWGYHRWGKRPVHKDDIVVFNNPANLTQPAIERREAFIGRCTGRPGDTLRVDSLFGTDPTRPTGRLRPLVVPARGATLRVRPWNITLLRNTLVLHEGRRAEIAGDTLLVDGKPVNFCRFTKDYYWVEADNATSLSGSRLFGFVPEDHLIGQAAVVWFSKEENTGLLHGYRWNRIWRKVK